MRAWDLRCRLEAFAECAMYGLMLPLVGVALIILSPLALAGWLIIKINEKEPK